MNKLKKVLIALGVIAIGALKAGAQNISLPVYQGGCVDTTIYVTSFTATRASQMDPGDLDTSTGTANTQNTNNLMADRKVIQVQNNDREGAMYRCAFSSSNIGPSPSLGGMIVASSATLTLNIPSADGAGNRYKVWCRASGAKVSTATVTQCK